MNDQNGKVKSQGKKTKNTKKAEAGIPPAKSKELEPCGKPQAQEALRFDEEDGACDDGVQ